MKCFTYVLPPKPKKRCNHLDYNVFHKNGRDPVEIRTPIDGTGIHYSIH
jgi:hypothetical protein